MKTDTKEITHSESQAKAQLDSILELLAAFKNAETAGQIEDAREAIQNDPLSVQVREGWHFVGGHAEAEEFEILLCTGGPAVRIVGELDRFMHPDSVRLQHQDWGTPWTDFPLQGSDYEAVLEYAGHFYFGE